MLMISYKNTLTTLLILISTISCTNSKKTNGIDTTIMEVTTFKINTTTNKSTFNKRDSQIENDFTSKQPGFIKRQSGVDENGNYVVIVYWESVENADASMNKFMGDPSVADYAQMIDATTMKMSRYTMGNVMEAVASQFVEIMSFDINSGVDMEKFHTINRKVETDFTGKRNGFLQRLTGVNESGKQIVVVYWKDKTTSDAALEPFMNAPIAKEFMGMMNQSSIQMGRYRMLN